jgi:coproporphyrinogen III oxidase-like Fe-S oxidoreductase
MFSERLLTAVMRRANDRYLTLGPSDEDRIPAPIPGRPYLLYVHIPFCERLCPYCSFNRFPYHAERATAYFKHLRDEMRMVAELGYDFHSMYVGGGTPTIDIGELVATIDLGKSLFSIKEVSAETNPNHLYPQWVDPLLDRVDRLSVGVQSLDDDLLRQMDRYDKYGSAQQILERLQSIEGRFNSLNADMIFNFPSQTPEKLSADIELVKGAGTNQVTFYPLMASPAVRESLKRTVGKVDYAREYRYYNTISEGLSDTFEPASAWTFSRTGGGMIDEYIVDYEDYVGIGSGAFSFLQGALYVNTFSLQDGGASEARFHRGRPNALPLPDGALWHAAGQTAVLGRLRRQYRAGPRHRAGVHALCGRVRGRQCRGARPLCAWTLPTGRDDARVLCGSEQRS